jgi:hypothetical protein
MRTLLTTTKPLCGDQLLVGLDNGGSVGRTANELARWRRAKITGLPVYQVASAIEDSISLPRSRWIFNPVRACDFRPRVGLCQEEVKPCGWGTKESTGPTVCSDESSTPAFQPAAVFVVPRWTVAFSSGKSDTNVRRDEYIQDLPCISGFFQRSH